MFSSPDLNLKNKFKLKSKILGVNKTSTQRVLLSNLFMDLADHHVNILPERLKNIHTLLDKVAIALSDSARRNVSGAIANASYFEKQQRWRYRLNFEKIAALTLPLVISHFSGATAIVSAFFSDR